MQYIIGFLIALFIALTGVGAGTITVPVLVLFLGVPAPVAVGIGLMFSAAVKLILVPAQIARGNVAWRTLGYMLLGGAPGVLVGSLFLRHLVTLDRRTCSTRFSARSWSARRAGSFSIHSAPCGRIPAARERSSLLPWLMFPVGAEVGFSSAGAGALGSAALLSPYAAGACAGCRNRHRLRLPGFAHRQRRALVRAR